MKDLSIGMRVRTAITAPDGCGSHWGGRAGVVKGFPGEGNVRVEFYDGSAVTCGPHDVIPERCEYFTRYGDEGVPVECGADATLELVDQQTSPRIRVCGDHAAMIVARFPSLGGRERFAKIPAAS